jgi:hypothetical protein
MQLLASFLAFHRVATRVLDGRVNVGWNENQRPDPVLVDAFTVVSLPVFVVVFALYRAGFLRDTEKQLRPSP